MIRKTFKIVVTFTCAFILITLTCVLTAACTSGTKTASNHPAGVDQTVWDRYCEHGNALLAALGERSQHTITDEQLVDRLHRAQQAIQEDANEADGDAIKVALQEVADAVGRAKVALDDGNVPDIAAIGYAAEKLPECG